MLRLRFIPVALVLIVGACGALAQDKAVKSPNVSITITNQGDLELSLTLTHYPTGLSSGRADSGSSTNSSGAPARPRRSSVSSKKWIRTIQPKQATTLEVPAGIYGVHAASPPLSADQGGLPAPVFTLGPARDVITNSEVWLFKLEPSQPAQRLGDTNATHATSTTPIGSAWKREVRPQRLHPFAMRSIPQRTLVLKPNPPMTPPSAGLPPHVPSAPVILEPSRSIPTRPLHASPGAKIFLTNSDFTLKKTNVSSQKPSNP